METFPTQGLGALAQVVEEETEQHFASFGTTEESFPAANTRTPHLSATDIAELQSPSRDGSDTGDRPRSGATHRTHEEESSTILLVNDEDADATKADYSAGSPLRSPGRKRGHGYRHTDDLLKYIDLDRDAFVSVMRGPHDGEQVTGVNFEVNAKAVEALRENEGPLHKLDRLKDEISEFNKLFQKKKAKDAKIAAAGKKKFIHVDKVKLVQLDQKLYYEMHFEFDLYDSLRLGRLVRNTPEKAAIIAADQRAYEEREAAKLRERMEAAALRIQALNRGNRAREEAKKLRQQQTFAMMDTRYLSSRGSSRASRPATRPSTAPKAHIEPQSPWDLFCAFCAGEDVQDSKKARTMDSKEWIAMITHLGVFPKRITKQKASEMFKQANAGAASDGDNKELDWDEFNLAFRSLAEHLGVHPLDVWQVAKPGFIPTEQEHVPMTDGLKELFVTFALGDPAKGQAQKGKRASSMDAREFMALLSHLRLVLVPEGVSKTFAMDCFTKGKAKNGNKRETSELDIQGFEWAMRKIARQTGADFASLHIPPEQLYDAQSSPRTGIHKVQAAVKKTSKMNAVLRAVKQIHASAS